MNIHGSSKQTFFTNIFNDLSFIVTFLGIALGITKLIIELGKVEFDQSLPLIGFILLFLIWVISSIIRASKSFVSPRKLPFPSSLWRIIFNNIPVEPLETYSSDTKTRILIIYDNSKREKLASIKEKYKDESLDINELSLDELKEWKKEARQKKDLKKNQNETKDLEKNRDKTKEKNLFTELKKCDALLLFWTNDFKNEKWLHRLIEDWALANSHKALLAVNMIPECVYDLNYNTIPEGDSDSSLWRLLSRATERGRLWRAQANSFRRIGILFALLLFFVFLIGGLKYENLESEKSHYYALEKTLDNKIKEIKEELNKNDLKYDYRLWSLIAKCKQAIGNSVDDYFKEEKRKLIQLIEDKLKEYSIGALNDEMGFDSRKLFVSFWVGIKYKEKENSNNYEKSGIRKFSAEDDDSHEIDTQSILGCSFFLENSFVLWKKEGKKVGDKACWKNNFEKPKKIEVTGKWKKIKVSGKEAWRIEFEEDVNKSIWGEYKKTDKDPKERKGLLCLSINNPSYSEFKESKKIMYGICLDSHLEPDFFPNDSKDNDKILVFMREAACIVQIIPQVIIEEVLIRDQNYCRWKSTN